MASTQSYSSADFAYSLLANAEPKLRDFAIKNGHNFEEQIKASCLYLKNAYREYIKEVNYASPYTRFAYIYKYFPLHSEMIYRLFSTHCKNLLPTSISNDINVAVFGGGPCPEMLGIQMYFRKQESRPAIRISNFDRIPKWEGYFNSLGELLSPSIKSNFIHFYGEKPLDKGLQISSFDIYTFSYYCAEVQHSQPQAGDNLLNMLKEAKKGAIFLFIDNPYHDTPTFIDSLISTAQLEILHCEDRVTIELNGDKSKILEYEKQNNIQHSLLSSASPSYRICQKQH